MCMSRDVYVRLCQHFRYKRWLIDSKHISVEEKIAIFLTIIGHNERFVIMKRRFQHSSQTVHKYFLEVLEAMMLFAKEKILSTTSDSNPHIPGAHKKLRKGQEEKSRRGAIGELDGTLVHAVIPANQQIIYRGRGKDTKLNVYYIHLTFLFMTDKYYLCDAEYPNTRGFLAPYRNIRYWLGDYHRRRAINKEEKFSIIMNNS
ncbi:uncharacterized protein [Nicotiana tomentosiformis]|uniref:uncharacterized protein n=1 Tax=Nicotiana tomentosiformis TaxID=4098 RepID=UPI00388CD33E